MLKYNITPSSLQGSLVIPSSKSHTLRAILFASLAKGRSKISRFLDSPDTHAMINAVRLLGAEVFIQEDSLEIEGTGGRFLPARDVIHCGNSGLVLRFIGAIAGLLPSYTILTGDHSIRSNRPAEPLLHGLSDLGAFAVSSCGNGYAPLIIKGPFTNTKARLDGQDSQPVSALLIASAFSSHGAEIEVENPGELPWIDLTLHWMEKLGLIYTREGYTYYHVKGNGQIQGFKYTVPGDLSSAAFPIAAALVTQSEITLHNIDLQDCQGDKKFFSILEAMGAVFTCNSQEKTLHVHKGNSLRGITIDINDCIDALPICSVIGCFAKGTTNITNAHIARKKESDRIHCIANELKKMGASIEEHLDGITIHHSSLQGAPMHSHDDHRIAMSLVVASLGATSSGSITGMESICKTYPKFEEQFVSLGATIQS